MWAKSIVFTLLSLIFVFENVFCKPAIESEDDPLTVCYTLRCPKGTTVCGKHSEISQQDKTKLDIQIRCYDQEGNILKSKNATEDNPFGPNVYYKGTRLSQVLRIPPIGDFESDDNDDSIRESNYVPVYWYTAPNYPKPPKSGPKSEVEDLNSR